MDIDALLARVPDFKEFYGVDELYGHAVKVADANPALCRLQYVGSSKANEPIPMVSVGDGPESILLFASPHPNEPIGAMMAYFLLDELIANAELRKGRTWHIIPCIDPDGTRLNEGWFKGPYTIRNYAKNFYRPKGDDQAEWSFPIEYKTFKFDRPIPETKALMKAIEDTKPSVMYSLHNAGFGGAYYYISYPLEKAYDTFHRLPTERNLPLSLGEPEVPYCQMFGPAVYRTNLVTDAYDYYEKYGKGDPAQYMFGGASSRDFADKVSKPFTLVTEVPYFMSPKIGDLSKIGKTRREVILEGIERSRKMLSFVQEVIDGTIDELHEGKILKDAAAQFTKTLAKGLEGEEKWAKEADGMDDEATVAQEADALYINVFYKMLIVSMYRRALGMQVEKGASDKLAEAYHKLDEAVDGWAKEIEEALKYEVVPIRDLVQIQYGALLAVLDALGK
ncbi:MAG TPA: M14 family zinc carboxypeptidase [Bacillota bacterium]|nr:M14 family zinc carboxypeptidase [Bacillota bacterium]HOH10933.1 M14 family zinc carboxypeptidase [Bacillota bacterium]HPI01640.1 M14 family zinc carboxypeptidase [Bacillota bacterium]HPM63773.1 M14 family zinc carboxypeptidase [Bacillota bacterium]HQJ24587.1 M14 family zinc carboxypeptidase [Bacillota bacterium]